MTCDVVGLIQRRPASVGSSRNRPGVADSPPGNMEQGGRFFEWLCFRLDRWKGWCDMAQNYGSDNLTHHLLQVSTAALVDVDQPAPMIAGRLITIHRP